MTDTGSVVERASVHCSSCSHEVARGHRRVLVVFFMAMAAVTFMWEAIKQLLFPGIALWGSHAMTIAFASAAATFAAHRVLLRQESQRAALQEAEARYRALVEEASDLIWQIDREGAFTFVGPRVRSMLGYESRDLLGSSRFALMRPTDAERMRALMKHGVRIPALEAPLHRKDGTWIEVETSVAPVFEGQDCSGSSGIDRDVSVRKRVEWEREEAERRRNEFLAMLSHELRNPLTPIRNSLTILQRNALGVEQARRACAVIDRQVTQVARLTDDLLDFTRVSRGKLRLQCKRLNLVDVVRRTIEDHEKLLENHEVSVELPKEPISLNGDPTRLGQVIGNLLNNAAKFTPEAGRISVRMIEKPGCAVLEVSDTGLGMDSESLARTFEPFAQAERSLDRSRGGLGLGLALVKGLVELHGGKASAHSDGPGRGARFTIALPLDERGMEGG